MMSLDPLAQINAVVIGAIIVIFLVTLIVLRRVCIVPIVEVMEKRSASVEARRAIRAEADAALEGARHEADRVLAAARAEAERIADAAKQEIAQRRNAAIATATSEAEVITAKGRIDTLALRQTEEARLADELHACVNQTLARMIGSADDVTVRALVTRVLAAAGPR